NQISVIPPEVAKLEKIKTLYLGGNNIISLSDELGSLNDLEELGISISINQFSTLVKIYNRLSKLRALLLGLAGNELTNLPPELWQLVKIESLSLDRNLLESISPEISNLINLKKLALGN